MKGKLYNRLVALHLPASLAGVIATILAAIAHGVGQLLLRAGYGKRSLELDSHQAREILEEYSPKPKGTRNAKTMPAAELDVTVVVPAYNVQDTIVRCLDSIFSQQTEYRYEVIVVEDGSTDATWNTLCAYPAHPHLMLLRQQNQGLSGARNTGIDQAKGEYLLFVDSDDTIPPNAIQSMMEVARRESAVLVQGSFETVYPDETSLCGMPNYVKKTDKNQPISMGLSGFAWGKLVHRSLMERIRFPQGYLFEDTIMYFILYRLAQGKTVATVEPVVYHYYKNPKGITGTYRTSRRSLEGYWIVEKMLEETARMGLPMDEQTFHLTFGHLQLAFWRTRGLPKTVREAMFCLACEQMDKVLQGYDPSKVSKRERMLVESYKNRWFQRWQLLSLLN